MQVEDRKKVDNKPFRASKLLVTGNLYIQWCKSNETK